MKPEHKPFWAGARTALPSIVSAAPFGALFGALAVENGMSVFEACLMSAIVFAGASQMVGIDLFGANVAPWLIVFSIFAVNFRHILYSAVAGKRLATFTPLQRYTAFFFLVDPHFAETERQAEARKQITFGWFMGGGMTWWFAWVTATWIGALFGRMLPDPERFGIDFLLPIYFLGLVMGFRKRALFVPVVVASGVASVLAFHFVGSPWHVSIGAIAGVIVAAAIPLQPAATQVKG